MRYRCPSMPRPVSPQAWLCLHAGAGVACLIMADWLFFGHAVGVSFAVYLVFLALVCTCVNPLRASKADRTIAGAILVSGIAALVYDFNFLSFCFGLFSLVLYSQILCGVKRSQWLPRMKQCRRLAWIGYFWMLRDGLRVLRLWQCRRTKKARHGNALQWLLPLVLGSIFVILFAVANPIIANALKYIDVAVRWGHVAPARFFFWCFVLGLVWPYLHMPCARLDTAKAANPGNTLFNRLQSRGLLSQGALFRSLVLFNALFAVQTGLDLAYLWGGLQLPDNVTYADYAHQGAYPLCCTAVIAALFVLAAAPSLDTANPPRGLRPLLMLWVGQNLLLVLSSILRLDLYVAAYSLTGLRVAAFLWMGLVGLGLVLISLKIYWHKSSAWLIGANALAAGMTLYLCCFVNFTLFIANYNIAHAASQGVEGRTKLDENYLISLGSQAIPAMDAAIEAGRVHGRDVRRLERARKRLANRFRARQQDWRAFSLESWRLTRYLDGKAASVASRPPCPPEHGS